MQELMLMEQGGKTAVSARDLHAFLGVKTDFTNWCKRMFDYGFTDGMDFSPFLAESNGGRPATDYALSLDCAKEISMLQRSDKGRQARQYFIECERKLKEQTPQLSSIDLIIQSAMAIKEQEQRLSSVEDKVLLLEAKTTTTPDYFTVVGFAIGNQVKIGLQMAAKIGARAKAICKQQGIPVESIPDPRFGKVGMYPKSVLQQAFDTVQFQ